MKKILNISYILLGVMILFNSCHREDFPSHQITTESDCPIEFSPVSASLETKSTSTTIEDFKVWASNKVNNVDNYNVFGSEGTHVEKSGDIWAYSPVRYWQPSNYNFYAVSPIEVSTLIPISGSLSSTGFSLYLGEKVNGSYTGWDLSVNQTDLLLASAQNVATRLNVTNTPVQLTFNHMLSKIRFSAKKTTDMQIDVVEVKIRGHYTTASSMGLSGNVVTWTLSNVSFGQEIGLSTPVALDKVQDTPVTSEILVFPQGFTETNKLTVEVTIRHADNAGGYPKSASITTDWQAGKQYDYVINVGPDGISFSEPSVEPWDDGTGPDGKGPGYTADDDDNIPDGGIIF